MSCPAPASLDGPRSGALAHVRYLADDALEGREVGSAAERCAAEYIEGLFQEFGLVPAGGAGGFRQAFRVRVGSELGTHNVLSVEGRAFSLGSAWSPVGFSGTGMAEAPVMAIDRGTLEDGSPDLSGKVALVSVEREGVDIHFTAAAAARAGAAAVALRMPGGALPVVERDRRPALPVPVVAVGSDLGDLLEGAADSATPVEIMAEVSSTWGEAHNVAGMLVGSGGPYAPVVVVGAHYDHLGFGGEGSLAPGAYGEIHNGADDNASGSAALLEVARRLSAADPMPYNVLFLAFSGEERGLWGSAHWVKEPTVALNQVQAMINMDMVGRLSEGSLTIFGVGTAEEWPTLLEHIAAVQSEPIDYTTAPDGYGPSDHSSFYGEGIPVLHFFTNTHEDYHRPSDDWEKIDGPGLDRIVAFVSDIASTLAGGGGHVMALTRISGQGTPTVAAGPEDDEEPTTASRGYGPYFGSIPDMTPFEGEGVRLTGVREGSPAEKAGLQKGDVIVGFGGHPVTDLYAYTYALGEFAPGDTVEVVVERDGRSLTLSATLERR